MATGTEPTTDPTTAEVIADARRELMEGRPLSPVDQLLLLTHLDVLERARDGYNDEAELRLARALRVEDRERALTEALRDEHDSLNGEFGECSKPCETCALLSSQPVQARDEELERPGIVCLCGSTRFMDAFHDANRRLSLEGKIVLTVEILTYDGATDPQRADLSQKHRLDELHLRKIDLADNVLVLNVGGYIGESTAEEILYAKARRKPVAFLEARQPEHEHAALSREEHGG